MPRLTPILTGRRRMALEALRRLGGASAVPVHYPAVAADLGVSAWTAYGLLRDLEAMGLAERHYEIPGGVAAGRSRILFAASPAAPAEMLSEAILRAAYERFSAIGDEAAAARAYLQEARGELAWHVGYWLGRLEAAGRQARDAGLSVLDGAGQPATKVQALAALGLGNALARLGTPRLASGLTSAAARVADLIEDAGRASDAGMASLVDAARRVQLQPPPAAAVPVKVPRKRLVT